MPTYTLDRTGDVPLRFDGEHLRGVSTQRGPGGQDRNRWYEVDLYRTRGGTYVLAVVYRTLWQGEQSVPRAVPCDSPDAVRRVLREFDPLGDVSGYPPGEAYRAKQDRLERNLRMDWDSAIRGLFAEQGAGDVSAFAEVIT